MNAQKLREIGFGFVAVILQIVFFRHLQIYTMQANIILVFLLWYMTRRNRTAAILLAAALGLTQDAILGTWGLNMFSYTLTVFIMHRWVPDDTEGYIQLPQVATVVFMSALFHNIFLLGLSSIVERYTAELLFWRHWIGNAAYTTITAGIIQLFRIE